MDAIDYWGFSDQYSIINAAFLIIGCNPDDYDRVYPNEKNSNLPDGFNAVKTALMLAAISGSIDTVTIKWHDPTAFDDKQLDFYETTISADALENFCLKQGYRAEFFERRRKRKEQSDHSLQTKRYPPKLRAALDAWSAISSDPDSIRGISPKEALKRWLSANASSYGLLNKNGTPNETGIEEVAKVANWKPEGGANPTPSSKGHSQTIQTPIRLPLRQTTDPLNDEPFFDDFDSETPF